MIELRPYQQDLKNKIYKEWINGNKYVMAASPTGSGKTVLFSDILREWNGAACAIAHRQELVCQISLALSRDEVDHKIIAPRNVIKFVIGEHMREFNKSYFNPNSPVGVAGVDTLIRRGDTISQWLQQCGLWIMDEGHHVLRENKWGKSIQLMPNAQGLAVTATPCRADGKGLSRDTDGLMDCMVQGPTMRTLINQGYLTDYRIFAPPSDLDLSNVNVSKATGDYNPKKLKTAIDESHVVGDVVEHYLRIAKGKLGITFATDVATATEISNRFNAAGVPSEVLSAKSKDSIRVEAIRRFKNRKILQLVNVDLFGEGFDLPAVEVVSFARPTQSYSLYVQQFGRALRIMEGKNQAIIIDHVSNVLRHGLPDSPKQWTLDRREKRPRSINNDDDIPLRYCVKCTQPYSRLLKICPYCGLPHVPTGRNLPEQVDGDLTELLPEILQQMRGEIEKIDAPPELFRDYMSRQGFDKPTQINAMNKRKHRQKVQSYLRDNMKWFAGLHKQMGKDDSQIYRAFYLTFGIDMMSAMTLTRQDATVLNDKINEYYRSCN